MKKNYNSSINDSIYEDPEVVAGYIQRNAQYSKQEKNIEKFLKYVSGKKILDLGCGPGQDSYLLSSLGYQVTGLDYSSEMVKQARKLREVSNKPEFIQGDMRTLHDYFEENYFDAIWASASLLHINKKDLPAVFSGMQYVLEPKGFVAISLKSGDGRKIVPTQKYGKPIEREFIFWKKDEFALLVEKHGFKVVQQYETTSGNDKQKTDWLYFILQLA